MGNLSLGVQTAKRKRSEYKGHVWRQEVGKLYEKWYGYPVTDPDMRKRRAIHLNYCRIGFPSGEDVGNGMIQVQIKTRPPGQRHEVISH